MYLKQKTIVSLICSAAGLAALAPAAFTQALPPAAPAAPVMVQRAFPSALPSVLPPLLDEARDLFNAGTGLYDEDRFAEAEKRFREVVARFPANLIADRADYYLIRTLSQLGKRNDALVRINAFSRQYPKSKYQEDVQEIRVRLTNRVPPNAEQILLLQAPPSPPTAPAAPPRAASPASPQAAPLPPAPPIPAVPRSGPFLMTLPALPLVPPVPLNAPFNLPGGFRSSDPEIGLQQEMLRAIFSINADRGLEIASERLQANPADPIALSSLNMAADSGSPQAVQMLLGIIRNSPDARARRDAIYWLARSRGVTDAIVDTLSGLGASLTDEEDSEAVVFALGHIRTDKSLKALNAIARDRSRNDKARSSAVYWIAYSEQPGRTALLEDIYKNSMDSAPLRLQVVSALNQSRDPQSVAILGNIASSDPDLGVRRQAVYALGQNKSVEAGQALERLLQKK